MEGDPGTKSIPAFKITFMVRGRLDSILGSYSVSGIDFSSQAITRHKYRHTIHAPHDK
jgi:hypothetical protein